MDIGQPLLPIQQLSYEYPTKMSPIFHRSMLVNQGQPTSWPLVDTRWAPSSYELVNKPVNQHVACCGPTLLCRSNASCSPHHQAPVPAVPAVPTQASCAALPPSQRSGHWLRRLRRYPIGDDARQRAQDGWHHQTRPLHSWQSWKNRRMKKVATAIPSDSFQSSSPAHKRTSRKTSVASSMIFLWSSRKLGISREFTGSSLEPELLDSLLPLTKPPFTKAGS